MEKFIPYEKLSKKEKRKINLAKRQTWGELNPVTRKPENSKAYNRNKARNWKREYHETNSGTFILTKPVIESQYRKRNQETALLVAYNCFRTVEMRCSGMQEWNKAIQQIVDEIDMCIKSKSDETMTLKVLSRRFGYSEFYISRKFREISGMQFRDYLRYRRLAFALKEVRDTNKGILDIAMDYGFSSNEAFTRAFREAYGITPSEYRKKPVPVVMRTIIRPFDCYIIENGETNIKESAEDIKVYFVTIPAHKFLHIRNYESIGYWDFWQKQSQIPGQDCETICGLLDSIKGKLDDMGGNEANSGSGQIMAFINEPTGRICSWGIPLAECYGVRLPLDYSGEVPPQMLMMDVPEGKYIVFEHGPFDVATQNGSVEEKIEIAMKEFDYASTGYCLDTTPGRVFYFFHDPDRFWKYIRPVRKV